jgi:hypothetical protein
MKNLMVSILFFCSHFAPAQELKIHETPNGYFVPFGRDIPRDFSYRISRRQGDQSFVVIGEKKVPASRDEYRQRVHQFQIQFPKLPKPNTNQIGRIWDHISKSGSPDRLYLISHVIENLSIGLAWQDTTSESGKTYQYKIEKVRNGQVISSQLTEVKAYFRPNDVDLPTAIYYKHDLYLDNINTRWLLFKKNGITGYDVFRRDNLKGDYRQIAIPVGYAQNLDSTFVHVNDTLAKKFEVYEYKLRPFDQFGNPGAFTEVTKIANFTHHDFPYLRTFKAVALNDRQIKLQWSMDFKPFIRSIKVLRSMSFDSAFVEIGEVSPRDSTYIDILPRSMENYYYRLKINGPEDVSISTSSTFVLYESDLEPDRPTGVAARTVKGGVELTWEDRQRNVFGYYVFRQENHESFVQVSKPIPFNKEGKYHYTDTTTGLHGDRFYNYAIKAISDSYVLSQFSDTLSARPGIDVPIASPKNLRGRKADGKVFLFWDDMSSTDNNLMGYKLFRKRSYEKDFTVLHDSVLNADTNHFLDSAIQLGYAYDYVVKAYNYFGSESDLSTPIQFKFYLNLPTPPRGVKAHKVREGIRIVWGEVLTNDLESFHLYKYIPGKKPTRVTTVPADRHDYLDPEVKSGQLYFYYVTSSNTQKIEGRPSEAVTARY